MGIENRIKLENLISKLSSDEIDSLYEFALPLYSKRMGDKNPYCPLCQGAKIVKNGHKCGKQEYLCKSCGKTFVSTTNTVMANSHQPREIWEEVIKDTLDGDSIDFTADRLDLTHDCVFRMRHKVLIALTDLQSEESLYLSEVTEMDETYVLDSYKGKHLPAGTGRRPRKHGAKATKRGISNEYVCICTGVQPSGKRLAETINRAKPSSEELAELFSDHITAGALVLCDGLRSYSILEELIGCSVKDVNTEEGKSFYNLNSVNSFHSFIKRQYCFYRGVATKYLNRYNALFSMTFKKGKEVSERLLKKLLNVGSVNRFHSCNDIMVNGLLHI